MNRTGLLGIVMACVLALCACRESCCDKDTAGPVPEPDIQAEEVAVKDLGVGEVAVDAGELAEDAGPVQNSMDFGGVQAFEAGTDLVVENEAMQVVLHMDSGQLDVLAPDGSAYLLGGEARLVLAAQGSDPGTVFSTAGYGFGGWTGEEITDSLGEGVAIEVTWLPMADGDPKLVQRIELRGGQTWLAMRLIVPVEPGSPLAGERILRFVPLVVDEASAGGLFVGADPKQHAVVDNGTDMFLDFVARVFKVGKGNSLFFPPGSIANWNCGIYDSETGKSVVAGFLSFREGMGLVALHYDESIAVEDGDRKGFTRFEGMNHLEPPKAISSAGTRESGLFYMDFAPPTIFDGLENFASRYATRAGKKLWTDVPTSWNSWGGGGGEGGLGTNINEASMLANLDAMEEDFKPFGMKWFVIDNGWEKDEGDWDTNEDRFPDHDGMDGMKWMAQEIESRGLIPGIWTAPFWVNKGSKIALEHPDWIADSAEMGGFLLGDGIVTLDLTHPEVVQFVKDHFDKLVNDWGYKWIKLDFSYYTLFNENMTNPELSAAEAYYDIMQIIRETIGPDTFFLTISAMGLGFDMADGGRTTLDNMPTWGDDDDQGTKITLRTAAHRYYLNWLWSNHHDLVFYRPTIGMTLNEARTWTSTICLLGGIVKLGDSFTMMHENPEWLDMARFIIPVYPKSARPLDMFELLHPEVYHLAVEREGRTWDVVGLFNWGTNVEVMSGKETPEEEKTQTLDLETIGLDPAGKYLVYGSWEQECEWVEDGQLQATLAPRTETVLVVRPEPDLPMVVATTRHLLGGAVDVTGEAVTEDGGQTSLTATVDTPVGHEFAVYVATAGFDLDEVAWPAGAVVGDELCEGVVPVTFTSTNEKTELKVVFNGK